MEFKSLEHYRKLKDAHASLQLQLQDAHAATGGLENELSATLADAGATDADIKKARRAIPTHLQNIEQGYGVPPPRIPGRPGTDAQRYTAMLAGTAKTLRVLLNNL